MPADFYIKDTPEIWRAVLDMLSASVAPTGLFLAVGLIVAISIAFVVLSWVRKG